MGEIICGLFMVKISWHREEEPHNNHETPGRQTKQSNQSSQNQLC